jgi:GNAT superfamily N-acetyltransferase
MSPVYETTLARKRDVSIIPGIELAAATLLADHAPAAILAETSSQQELQNAQAHGHLWVALADDVPVGFAQVELLEPDAVHLKEIDVLPEHGRRGLGRKLVMTVCEWAANSGYGSVTLTTFRDVAWNMPFYARLGFAEIPANELTAALLEILHVEASRGLDPARRVAMRRPSK